MRPRHLFLLAFATAALSTGCDERINPLTGTVGEGPAGSSTFSLTPTTLTLAPGQTAQLTLNSARPIGPYTWSTNQAGVATVSQTGLVTAVGTGAATITVTAAADGTVSARTTVTVSPASTP